MARLRHPSNEIRDIAITRPQHFKLLESCESSRSAATTSLVFRENYRQRLERQRSAEFLDLFLRLHVDRTNARDNEITRII